MMTRTKKIKRMTTTGKTRKMKSQPSSENRANVDADRSGVWLLEITDHRLPNSEVSALCHKVFQWFTDKF